MSKSGEGTALMIFSQIKKSCSISSALRPVQEKQCRTGRFCCSAAIITAATTAAAAVFSSKNSATSEFHHFSYIIICMKMKFRDHQKLFSHGGS